MSLDGLPRIQGIPLVNSIALSIVIIGFVVRIFFGRSAMSAPLTGADSLWKNKAAEPWHPWQGHPLSILLTTLAVALLSGLIAQFLPGSTGLAFGIGALTLIFLSFGARIPIILHISWASEYAVLLTGDLGYGLFCGLLAALVAQISARLFLLHGDTHIDPPSLAVAASFSLGPLLASQARNGMPAVLSWILTSFMALVLFLVLSILHRRQESK